MKSIRKYEEKEPFFAQAGAYIGWVHGSASRKHSAAAWRVEAKGNSDVTPVQDAKISLGESTAPRAFLGAFVGVLETLPGGSTLDLFATDQNLLLAIEKLKGWEERGWQGTKGPLKNSDILKQAYKLIIERNLTVRANKSDGSKKHCEIFDRLKKLAQSKWRDAE